MMVNTHYNIQMMYYRIAHLKPIYNFVNQCHPNKFNKN